MNELEASGHEAYAVGGCVRDCLMGRVPSDWDITTDALPEEVKGIFKKTFDTGIEHGTVTVLIDHVGYEVTTYRVEEGYSDMRHPDHVRFTRSLEEDLKRRDFTINAMACGKDGEIVDIFGGRDDMEKGLIRAVGDPRERFGEDALRMMRAVRFAATTGFEIEEGTRLAIKELAGNLSVVSAERIRVELEKLLVSPHPERMRDLYELGLSAVFMPEFDTMMETVQNNPHHMYTVGEHTIKALEEIEPDRLLRLAMLFHDVSKPECKTTDDKGIDHFKGHQTAGADLCRRIMRRLKFDNDSIKRVSNYVLWHDANPRGIKAVRRLLSKAGYEAYPGLFSIKRADVLAQSDYRREEKLSALEQYMDAYRAVIEDEQCVKVKDLKIGGKDLMDMGVPSGPRIGEILNVLLEAVIEEPELNDRQTLLAVAEELATGGEL
ncbi:MAG: CCA tRNA nucleotidyltransferase [Eubacterium sp.]|nr:CCA tRNA nucleotidyltransferase [Eubacterium sp.]